MTQAARSPPRFSCEVCAREGRPPVYVPEGMAGRGWTRVCGTRACSARAHLRIPGGAGAGAAGAGLAKLGTRRARGGAASPAHSIAATTRRAAPTRPWPSPAPALLRATCRRLLLRAARRLPSARPMGGGRHSGAERRGTIGVSSTSPHNAKPPKSKRSSSRPAAARLPALRYGHCRPASPGTVQRAGTPAEGGA